MITILYLIRNLRKIKAAVVLVMKKLAILAAIIQMTQHYSVIM